MKDLDFDELDKAVNSLMGGVKESDSGEHGQTLDISTTLAPDEKPAYGTLNQVAGQIGSEAIDRQEKTVSLESAESTQPPMKSASESPRAAGRFMDVVHPSSDMKRSTSAKVSREGTTITPVSTPVGMAPQSSKATAPALPEPAPTESADISDNLPVSAAPELERSDSPSVVEQAPAIPEPLSSPFLPDTKVEKRPLGGEPPTGTSPVADESEHVLESISVTSLEPDTESGAKKDESSVMDNITNPSKDEDNTALHVPEEFQDELLAVEKNTDTITHDVPEEKAQIAPAHESMLGTASIPKQYQEKPSTGDTKSGAIYDTDHYHKPLAHPAKKSSGWLWVIAIVVIIALGAGAGAFVYFVGL